MAFQIHALPEEQFSGLFTLSDAELKDINAERVSVTDNPGLPCRVSLQDALVGETVILLNYFHQPSDTAYKSSHAIFVREGARQTICAEDEIPDMIARRLLSVRAFDASHRIVGADVVDGADCGGVIEALFADDNAAYLHMHFAKYGCFAARVERIESVS